MWTVLVVLCLIVSFDVNAAKREALHGESSLERSHSTAAGLRNVEDIPARFPRKFRGNSRTRRLHIENQHGFDGKVEKIHINSEEDVPAIPAYEMQKKNLADYGHIEKTIPEDLEEAEDVSRVARSIEAYGKSEEKMKTSDYIEYSPIPPSSEHQLNSRSKVSRSILEEPKGDDLTKDLEDLEAQDAKVFRPLFVYRQQVAKRQHRGRNQIRGSTTGQKPSFHHDLRIVF